MEVKESQKNPSQAVPAVGNELARCPPRTGAGLLVEMTSQRSGLPAVRYAKLERLRQALGTRAGRARAWSGDATWQP